MQIQLIGRAVHYWEQACRVLSQATEFSILHRKRSPSFHMEGGLGSCKLVGLFYRKKIVGDALKKPSFPERGGTALAVGDSRRVWLVGRVVQRSAHKCNSLS